MGEFFVTLSAKLILAYTRMRFYGNIEAKSDLKGRVFLPSVFRKELTAEGESVLIMRKDVYQKCLVLYPESVWNQMLDSMRARLNRWDVREQQVFRQFVAAAETVTLDGSGRFLINRKAAEAADITGVVSFIGMGDSIEIWAAERMSQPLMPEEDFRAAIADLLQ